MVYVPERVWIDRGRYLEAELNFFSGKGKKARDGSVLTKQSTSTTSTSTTTTTTSTTSSETINQQQENPFIHDIYRVRSFIQKSLNSTDSTTKSSESDFVFDSKTYRDLTSRIRELEAENANVKAVVDDLVKRLEVLEIRCIDNPTEAACRKKIAAGLAKAPPLIYTPMPRDPPVKIPAHLLPKPDDDDDDLGLFGDDDSAPKKPAAAPVKVEKKKKGDVIAKSSVVLDIKPWDDETDMAALEKCVRSIEKDGLLWGTSKLAPVAYNVKKLQIVCVVEDEKVSIEELSEQIEGFEDYVQSVDVAAFNKI